MAKKTHKPVVRSEKNNAGCMSGLINIFDFRQGRSTQRLLSNRRLGSARHAGIGNSKGELKLTSSEDKPKSVHSVNNNDGTVDFGRSVKILMEEEMSRVKQPKNPKADTAHKSIEVSCENNHKKESEDSVLCDHLHFNDKTRGMSDKSNNLSKAERLYYNIQLAGLLEEICGDRHQCQRLLKELKTVLDLCPSQENADKVACDFQDQPDTKLDEDHSTIHKVLIESAEALMSRDGKVTLNKTPHPSGNLTTAVDMINSKELLLQFLKDRGSHLVKHIEEIKNDKEDKSSEPRSCKLLQEENVRSEQREDPISHKMSQKQNVNRLFRKKDKLLEAKVSNGGDGGQAFNKIVVLKPTPPRGQTSSNVISLSPSPSFDKLRAEKVASNFSLKEIKRRLKHAIGDNGKGHHIVPMDGVLHRIPNEIQPSGDSDNILKDSGHTKSISSTSHHKGQESQLTPTSKNKDKKLKPKERQPSMVHEYPVEYKNLYPATSLPHREYNFQREARKHLVEMFNNVDTEANMPFIQNSKPLGRMLSLSEFNFLSPWLSPGREKESTLSPHQMRFSPFWQLKQENGKHSSPLRESNVEAPCTASSSRTLDQVFESDLNTKIQGNTTSGEMSLLENLPDREISSPKGCARPAEVEQLDNEHGQKGETLNVPSELSTEDSVVAVERSEETPSYSSLSSRAMSSETIETVALPVPSTPITLLLDDIGSLDAIIEKPDRPSPVSVLEPLFAEDDSSPASCTDVHVDIQLQPQPIHFDKDENSVIVLTTSCNKSDQNRTCLKDKECRFEYVRAVIEASGLLHDLLTDRWHASPLLSPSLYDEVEYSSDDFPDDLRLLFDSIDEVLKVLHTKFFGCTPWASPAKSGVRPIPSKEDFIKLVWKGVDQCFLSQVPHTLEQIVGSDMNVIPWMDLRSEIDNIGIDMGDAILNDIVEEALFEIWGCTQNCLFIP